MDVKTSHRERDMHESETAVLVKQIHAAIYGNGRAGLLERVTVAEQRLSTLEKAKARTPKVKSHVLRFTVGSGAITSLSHLLKIPELTLSGALVTGLLTAIWFVLDWQEKHEG